MLNKAYSAASISVENVGSQTIIGNTTVQNILININKQSDWTLNVTPITNGLINTFDSSKVIPLERVTMENATSSVFNLIYNNATTIDSGTNYGTDRIPFKFVVQNSPSDTPGIYSGTFIFSLISGSDNVTATYTLTILVNGTQSMILTPATLNITVNGSGLLQPNYSQETATPETITLTSNIGWNLILGGQTFSNGINYEFKVLSVPEGATTPYSLDYYPYPASDIIIASGSSAVTSGVVQVNYRVTINQSGIQPAGIYSIIVPYHLSQ